jgi:hypothetical protein
VDFIKEYNLETRICTVYPFDAGIKSLQAMLRARIFLLGILNFIAYSEKKSISHRLFLQI